MVSFVVGVFCAQFCSHLWGSWVLFLLFVGATSIFAVFRKQRWAFIGLVFVFGFCWMQIYSHHVLAWRIPPALIGKTVTLSGEVDSIPIYDVHSVRFQFLVHRFQDHEQRVKIRLSWYGLFPHLKPGDRWQLQVRLKPPHGTLNPGGFDYERWLFAHKIRAIGYVVKNSFNKQLPRHYASNVVNRIRQHLARQMSYLLGSKKLSAIIPALTVGFRANITRQEWQVFRRTGTSHLIAISGLHVGMVFGLLFGLINFLWRRVRRLMLWCPAQQAALIGGLVAALCYSGMAGFSLPTQRALIMILVFVIVRLKRQVISISRSLIFALFVVVLIDPLSIMSVGIWLSFAAVSFLIYGLSGRVQPSGLWWRYGRAQWVIALGLLPLSLFFFQQGSFILFPANLIAIPWVGLVVVPLSLLGCLLLPISSSFASVLLGLAVKSLQILWPILEWFASFRWAMWHHVIFNPWILMSSMIGILIIVAPKGWPARWLGGFWLLPLFFYQPARPPDNQLWMTMLDVGQGLSVVLQTAHHVLVYDVGPKYSETLDSGANIVVPFLRKKGIHKVDRLIISHGDNDHSGGAQSLIAQIPVLTKLTSRTCFAGQQWRWDGVTFKILSPEKNTKFQGNDASCVLRVSVGNESILLPGDIEKPTERWLLQHHVPLKSTILISPHHGSRSSSSSAFIKAVSPKVALFPTGFLNRFHFPSKKVMNIYRKRNITMLNTAYSGAISIKINGNAILNIDRYSSAYVRFWRG